MVRGKNIPSTRFARSGLRKIASCLGGRLPQKRISFSLFAPFNLLVPSVLICERSEQISRGLFSETEKKLQCQKNQKLTTKGSPERSRGAKICQKKHALSEAEGSTSGPSADPWFVLYKLSKPFFFTAFQVELTAL